MSSLSSKNVIYGFQVAYDVDPEGTIIDSNHLAAELIGREERLYKEKLLAQEREERLEAMRESGAEIPEGVDVDEFLGLADAIAGINQEEPVEEEPEIDYVAEAMAEAERILANANAEANEIISSAELNAEALKNIANQDGHKEGYNEGIQQAALELQRSQQQMEEEIARIKEEYTSKALNLEHEIVDMCLPVFEKVFMAELSGKKDVIYHLLDNAIMKIARSKQMQIKVAEVNSDFIKSKKDDILARVGSDVVLDIISDPLLNENQCVVETDGGIFDCSIDTELDALIREIRALD